MRDPRDIAGETARALRQSGLSGERADKAAVEIARHVDRKMNGLPVPDRFRPIQDSKPRR